MNAFSMLGDPRFRADYDRKQGAEKELLLMATMIVGQRIMWMRALVLSLLLHWRSRAGGGLVFMQGRISQLQRAALETWMMKDVAEQF
jgi:hypothetical protein